MVLFDLTLRSSGIYHNPSIQGIQEMRAPNQLERCMICHKPAHNVSAQPQSLKERVCPSCLLSLQAENDGQRSEGTSDFNEDG